MHARTALIVLALMSLGGCVRDQYGSVDDVPPRVRDTFEREAHGGSVSGIYHQWKKGYMVYTADVTDAQGKVWDVHVAEDGRLISKD